LGTASEPEGRRHHVHAGVGERLIEDTIEPYFVMGEQRVPDGFKPISVKP
jgi:hypothetical protein